MMLRSFSETDLPLFNERLVVIPSFLPEESFAALKKEIESLTNISRGHVPLYRKGGAISYDTLSKQAPHAMELRESTEYQAFLARIIKANILPTPSHHPNSLSVLVYDRPGDHIAWHYDKNYYRGRYFTVLLAIDNTGHAENGLSSLRLLVKKKGGDVAVATPPNTLVIFEGSKIFHRTTQLKKGERRIVLSMTYSTNPTYSFTKDILRRIKDVSFFGLRALWT